MGTRSSPPELFPGTLDLLILRSLVFGPMHRYCIALRLKQVSDDVLRVGESSLYPALQRLLNKKDRTESRSPSYERNLLR